MEREQEWERTRIVRHETFISHQPRFLATGSVEGLRFSSCSPLPFWWLVGDSITISCDMEQKDFDYIKKMKEVDEKWKEMTSHSFHSLFPFLFSSIDSFGINETDLHSNDENERKSSIEEMEQERVRIEIRSGKRGQCSDAELAISLL